MIAINFILRKITHKIEIVKFKFLCKEIIIIFLQNAQIFMFVKVNT